MATGIRWPLGFPPPLRDGYQWEPHQGLRSQPFQPEHGTMRVRRKATRADRTVDVKWFIEGGQPFIDFTSWWRDDLASGERLFDIELEQDGGQGLIWYTCRWVGEYSAESTPEGNWFVTGKLITQGSGFATRTVGSLRGRAAVSVSLRGTLIIVVALRSSTSVDVVARGKLKPAPFRGRAALGVFSATGMLAEVPTLLLTEDGAYSMTDEEGESIKLE